MAWWDKPPDAATTPALEAFTGASAPKLDEPVTASGLGKAFATGARSGVEGAASLGDVATLQHGAIRKLARMLGFSEDTAETAGKASDYTSLFSLLPKSEGVRATTDAMVKQMPDALSAPVQDITRHEAGNAWERGAETTGEFAAGAVMPGGAGRRVIRGVVLPALGTEAGGYIGKQYGHEGIGRVVGGGVGAASEPGAERALTGGQLNPERARLVNILREASIPVTAGQASGRKALQYMETGPYNTKPASMAERQGERFNRAALNEAGITADRVTPETVQAARDSFGNEYEGLIQQTGGLPLDSQMETDLLTLIDDYGRLKGNAAAPAVRGYFDRISDAARDNGNVIPTDVFRQIRSDISKDLRTVKDDPTLSHTLREFQDTLYGSIERNAAPGTEQAWRDLNNRYRNFKTIEKAMGGAGADTAEGMISPSKLRTATAGQDKSGYLAERGDLDALGRAGEAVLKPLPQSGTAARAALPAMASAAGSALFSGHPLAAAGVLAGGVASPAISSLLTSRPVRTRLINNMTGQGPLPIDPMTAALIARQAERGGGQ